MYLIEEDGRKWSGVSGNLLLQLRQRNWEGVEGFTLQSFPDNSEFNLIGENDELLPYELTYMETDSLYYKMFTPTLISGSWEQVANTRNSIVLTRPAAIRMFGDVHQAIGRRMEGLARNIRGKATYTIHAGIEDLPENASMNFMRTVDM